MSATPLPLLGRIAVQLKFITNDQLAAATRKQADLGGTQNIGTVLCEMGFLSQQQLAYAASDVLHLHALKHKLDAMLAREGRVEIAQSCFDFLPTRAALDLAGWEDTDIFAHS